VMVASFLVSFANGAAVYHDSDGSTAQDPNNASSERLLGCNGKS